MKRSGRNRTVNRKLNVGSNFEEWQEAKNQRVLNTPDEDLNVLDRNLKRQLLSMQHRGE